MRNLSVLIPDEWGKSSDDNWFAGGYISYVLIPDEWGKSSDTGIVYVRPMREVLIPDEWGKSSDEDVGCKLDDIKSLNPR